MTILCIYLLVKYGARILLFLVGWAIRLFIFGMILLFLYKTLYPDSMSDSCC